MTAIPHRDPYQGVLQIVRFNWPKYLVATACIGAAEGVRPLLAPPLSILLLVITGHVLFWTVSSLLISHYVYDRSRLYELSWLPRARTRSPRRWLSIHCGFDEMSPLLAAEFPDAYGEVVDIFDPRAMTENSIRQARRAQPGTVHSTPARFYALPYSARAFHTVFCIFAAHELRRHADRVRLFTEIARILAPYGAFILVEHLRDWPNFLAFGPGFLHFHSWRAWQRAARDAGLILRAEFPFTPFVRVASFGRSL
jgi:SAM-dependent methyltransferase